MGQILLLNTLLSWTFALVVTPCALAVFAPATGAGGGPRGRRGGATAEGGGASASAGDFELPRLGASARAGAGTGSSGELSSSWPSYERLGPSESEVACGLEVTADAPMPQPAPFRPVGRGRLGLRSARGSAGEGGKGAEYAALGQEGCQEAT